MTIKQSFARAALQCFSSLLPWQTSACLDMPVLVEGFIDRDVMFDALSLVFKGLKLIPSDYKSAYIHVVHAAAISRT